MELFKRQFNKEIPEKEQALFSKLKDLVKDGKVYPAFRVDELHFYHAGGLLFKFTESSFKRSLAYLKRYDEVSEIKYAKAKGYCDEQKFIELAGLGFAENVSRFLCENRNKFEKGKNSLERRALSEFCSRALTTDDNIIVLDIEINFNTEQNGKKTGPKPDLLLLNKETREIMFVEGKLSSHEDVMGNDGKSRLPRVHKQLSLYNELIALTGEHVIATEYIKYFDLLKMFNFNYTCSELHVLPKTKLLVIENGGCSETQKQHVIRSFGEDVIWLIGNVTKASLDTIWNKSGVVTVPEQDQN
jgi:hypothetical protein